MRIFAILILALACFAAHAGESTDAGVACMARSVSNDTAVGVYAWVDNGGESFPPWLAQAVADAAVRCGMVPVLEHMPYHDRLMVIMDALGAIALRGEGLTV
jgi:hypothetical protein